ncbi:MAG TPA: choice-of-anchor tandem repeat GloVer-containing protein [Candidatus Binataceae bacterium]|nr:choice-of-anchor tandem repeat GloVer-containing protein [Candidatus Binataceae bacterium]
MKVPKTTVVAMASLGRKNRVASVIFVVLALLLASLAVCAPAARAQSWGEVVLHSFAGTDGEIPDASLIQGGDGNFYGTTDGAGADVGGTNANGTVFKITPSGTLTTLYSFCSQANCTDGAHPEARLIQGSDGNFYGTTRCGGANVHVGADPCWTNPGGMNPGGTVFKITPSGTLTNLYSFCSVVDLSNGLCTDGAWPVAGLIQGSDGNFYGTTSAGGANPNGVKNVPGTPNVPGTGTPNGRGTVFRLTPSGTLTSLYSFCSQADCIDGEKPLARLIQGSDGNFYGTTESGGGAKRGGTVFKITPSGTLTTLYSFCSQADCTDGASPNGVIQGGDGNFYGTTTDGGANRIGGTVFKITPSGTLTTLYSFCPDCSDGASPNGVIQGGDGNFYGTTTGGPGNEVSTVFKLTPSGKLTTLYSFCSQRGTCTCTDGDGPNDLIQGSDGNFYGTTSVGGANGYEYEGGAKGYGTVFKVGASLPTPTNTPTATSTPGHITVIPNESACDVSKAKADDLVALSSLSDSNSPSVKCTVEGLSPASYYCDEKTQIVRDEMLGQGRRLIVRRTYTRKSPAEDQVFVFGCAFGRVVRMLDAGGGGEVKIEHADPNKVIFLGPPPPPGTNGPGGRQTLDWDAKMQSYAPDDGLPPLANTLPCAELKTAKANDLIILANHEFNGEYGGFPFTHGVGCYDHDDWKVTLDKDRMISANRREIFFDSDHLTGTGTWGYSYVFGCVAGQVRLVFGTASLRGAVTSACDEQAPSESGQPDSQAQSAQSPQQPSASPTSGYNCGSWEDSKSDQLTFIDAAWASGEHYCSACGASGEEVMTFKWRPELQNYLLTSVHYRPSRD